MWKRSSSSEQEDTSASLSPTLDSLDVNAMIDVFVDMNLPVRQDVSKAMSFPPVKLLLQQAGSLTTKAILTTLTPTLSDLLRLDHEKRAKVSSATRTTTSTTTATAQNI